MSHGARFVKIDLNAHWWVRSVKKGLILKIPSVAKLLSNLVKNLKCTTLFNLYFTLHILKLKEASGVGYPSEVFLAIRHVFETI